MKIGAAGLIHAWGRDMTLSRNGTVIASFKGRKYQVRAHDIDAQVLDYSVDQTIFFVVAAYEDLGGVTPLKFDVLTFGGVEYTVQKSHDAGADEDEVIRILVKGGQT